MAKKDAGDRVPIENRGAIDADATEQISGKFPVARPTERMVRAVEEHFGAALVDDPAETPQKDWDQRRLLHDRLAASIIALCRDAIVSQTLDGIVTSWNHAAEELFQLNADAVLGRPFEGVVPTERRAELRYCLQRVGAGATVEPFEMTQQRAGGGAIEVAATLSPISDVHGDIIGVSLVARDITKLKRSVEDVAQANLRLEGKELALESQAKELARSNRALEEFAYIASHDLQEPLRTVASFAQLLADEFQGKLGAAADQYIFFAIDGAKRMQQLIDDLLEYSRVGIAQETRGPLDCADLLVRVIGSLRVPIEEVQPLITIHELPKVWANSSQLELVFRNLISNAIKFRGDARLNIEIGATREEDCWEFSVCDNGSGFDPADAERIFEMFQRLGQGKNRPGSGIGLAIVKKVIESHDGKVWARSQPGQGACFYFTLPDP